jgi:hypothetical protein
MPTKPIKKT